jgi:hypothetical protein
MWEELLGDVGCGLGDDPTPTSKIIELPPITLNAPAPPAAKLDPFSPIALAQQFADVASTVAEPSPASPHRFPDEIIPVKGSSSGAGGLALAGVGLLVALTLFKRSR